MELGKLLIDTSILIDYFRKKNIENTFLYQYSDDFEIKISIITEFEFLIGFPDDKLTFAKELIKGMETIDINKSISDEAQKIYLNLKKINKLIPFPDLFIAATSVYYNIPFATLNKKHFKFIEGIILF